MLKNRKILLGVTGSIAVYKSVELTRRLVEEGASVHVILTDAARKFVTPLTFEVISQNSASYDTFQEPMSHIALTSDADLMVVAPATANIIGKFANGIGDDMLSTCFLSFSGKVVIAPAMNRRMYENPIVRKNLKRLAENGVLQVGPETGGLACGEYAVGRMSEIPEIIEAIKVAVSKKDLSERKIVVTAGPTREYMDRVRFISNRSSGKMGIAIARAAVRRGAEVIFVCGPLTESPPSGAVVIPVETAADMREAVLNSLKDADAVIMAAAVADFSPIFRSSGKIDKSGDLSMRLARTPDILGEIGSMKKRPFLVGFAAEIGGDKGRAKKKLLDKGADMIVFNDVTAPGSGFDVDTNEITIIEKKRLSSFPLLPKEEVADVLLDRIVDRIP